MVTEGPLLSLELSGETSADGVATGDRDIRQAAPKHETTHILAAFLGNIDIERPPARINEVNRIPEHGRAGWQTA
jgi:hypothetical protein